MIHQRGGLFVFDDQAAFERGKPHFEKQRAMGIACEFVDASELRQMEPGLSERIVRRRVLP